MASQSPVRLRKTELSRRLLADRASMAPALRMWLITVDGQRDEAQLCALAQGLGLDGPATIARLLQEGWLSREAEAGAIAQRPAAISNQDVARRLVAARMFAIDLLSRMMAGREGKLRERWRQVDDMDSFKHWVSECAAELEQFGGADRADLFIDRVSEVLGPGNKSLPIG